jgi:nucleoside 2-deoxyribosyltransferase
LKQVYISAPFKSLTSDIENRFYGIFNDENYQDFLEGVETHLIGKGLKTCLPHRSEGEWGKTYILPEDITEICFRHIRDSDLIICFPGNSRGVHMEIGYAAALGKEIIALLSSEERESTLLRGLGKVTKFKLERFSTLDQVFELLDQIIKS